MGGPKSARGANITRIDSADYEDRLNDIATSKYYDWLLPYEDDLEKEAAYWQPLWKSEDPDIDPWERLYFAVIAVACHDYLGFCEHNNLGMMQQAENWFRKDELRMLAFEEMTYQIRNAPTSNPYGWVKRNMRMIL